MEPTRSHIPSLLSSLLFILGAVLGLSVAVLMGVVAMSRYLTGGNVDARETIILAIAGFEGLILLGAAFVSIQKFLRRPSAERDSSFTISAWQAAASIIVAGTALFIGHQIVVNQTVNWLLLPVLTLVAVILPLLILLGLGIRKIPLGTRWQTWSVFGLAMTIAPFILFFLEVIAMVAILILAVGFIAFQPALVFEMEMLAQQIYMLGPESEAMLELLAPFMTRPGVIAMALIYFAVLVPLMEELIKPLGVWLFANQLSSPAQGFALGAMSGSAYALIETLGVSVQTTDWAALLLSRIGTGVLHVTASALMGGAIALAVRERRYMRLLGTYLVSVSLHGLWNALAIFYTFSTLAEYIQERGFLYEIRLPVVVGMAILAIAMLVLLIQSNRRMRKTIPLEAGEPAAI